MHFFQTFFKTNKPFIILQSTLVLEKSPNLLQNTSLYQDFKLTQLLLQFAVNIGARFVSKFIAKYESVLRFLIDRIAITCCSQLWC